PIGGARGVMKFGVTVGGSLSNVGSVAQAVEERGYHSVWTAETASSAYIQAAVVAAATSRVRIGTAVALAFPRSPSITAMNAADIDELSGGRFILGIGPQVKRVNELRFSTPFEHPAPKMAEYALAVRAFIGGFFGETPDFKGRFYTITMAPWARSPKPIRRDIPIFFAAVNKFMLRASGEVADGIVGHPMTSVEYVRDVVRPQIAKGAEKAGRKTDEIEISQQLIVSISEDRERAKREVKQQIGFYATTRTYTPVLALHGFEEVVPKLREAFAEGDMAKLSSIVTDEMADTFGLYGTPDEVKEKVQKYEGLVDEVVLAGPWYRVEGGRDAMNYLSILDTFAN
ncbi:MAG: LLM class flavin-dependent oxidoreductase, partial [Acidimicrobiia bacterium]